MNAQAILAKISEDAREAASAILNDANDQAAAIKEASEQGIEQTRLNTLAQAENEAEQLEQRMYRMEELEQKKLLLAAKRELIEQAFALALEKMKAMSAQEARSFLLATLLDSAQGTEAVIIGAVADAWYTPDFVNEANQALMAKGLPGKLQVSDKRRQGVSGLILSQNDIEISCTYEAMVTSIRLEMESQVASILFP